MKHEVKRRGRRALLVLLIGCLLGLFVSAGPVMAQDANPLRVLPTAVAPGDIFQVSVTFTSPADGFAAVGLSDAVPAGWTVRVNTGWCTPPASYASPAVDWSSAVAQYIWFGPYNEGVEFTAVYEVQVPPGAALDTYGFPGGTVEYYISGAGPYVQPIAGDDQVWVALYDLTVGSTAGGNVTTPGEGVFTGYEPGAMVDLVAVADACYEFTGWTGHTGSIADPASATAAITMDGDYSITANFGLIQYDLTAGSTAGGSVTTPGEGTYTYDCGQVVDLAAVADACYEFTGWTGDTGGIADPSSATTTITMDDDYSITANFAMVQYDLTVDSTAGGSVTTPGEGTYTYDCGHVVDLVAVADACYEFTGWTGHTGSIADPSSATTTIAMDGDYSITANFAMIQYDLTIDSTAGGNVTTPGEGTYTYDCGEVVGLVAAADAGYWFVEWTGDVDGIADVNAAITTVTMGDDYSITAEFGTMVASIEGQIRGANCAILGGVNVSLYDNGDLIATTLSDGAGHYEFGVAAFGDYRVVASHPGFKDEEQDVSVTESTAYVVDFVADHGLIPNAADISYVLKCVNLWQYGSAPCALTMPKVLAVINAWQYPVHI